MKTNRASRILEGDLRVASNKKIWFFIPAVVAILAAIMLLVYTFAANSPINLSVDFSGGYSIVVRANDISNDYDDYVDKIKEIACSLESEDGDAFGLRVADTRLLGYGVDTSIYVRYKAIKGFSDAEMEEVGVRFQEELVKAFTHIVPEYEILANDHVILTYDRTMNAFISNINSQIRNEIGEVEFFWENPLPVNQDLIEEGKLYSTILKVYSTDTLATNVDALVLAATIIDDNLATISEAGTVSGSIGNDLINYTFSALIVLLVVVFAYFAIRFKSILSGFAIFLSLLLDLALLFFVMVIFHMQIGSLFFALMMAMVIFSAYNKAVLLVKIKENIRQHHHTQGPNEIVDNSIRDIFKRTVYMLFVVAIVTVIFALVNAICGVATVACFALTLLMALVLTTFTTLFFTPSFWLVINRNFPKPKEKIRHKKTENETI